jgi:hypothetical protein
VARPRLKIDSKLVKSLAGIHCTTDEIAIVCGVSKDTIERRCMKELEAGRAEGRASLRRLQWAQAQKGNVSMLIWLGKQILGQKDRHFDDEGDGKPIALLYNLDE